MYSREDVELALEGLGVRGGVRAAGSPGGAGVLLPPAPPVAEGDQREHQRAPRGVPPEGHGPVGRQRRGGSEGVRWPQPQAAQALRLEVPLGGIPRRGVALALTIRIPIDIRESVFEGLDSKCVRREMTKRV